LILVKVYQQLQPAFLSDLSPALSVQGGFKVPPMRENLVAPFDTTVPGKKGTISSHQLRRTVRPAHFSWIGGDGKVIDRKVGLFSVRWTYRVFTSDTHNSTDSISSQCNFTGTGCAWRDSTMATLTRTGCPNRAVIHHHQYVPVAYQ